MLTSSIRGYAGADIGKAHFELRNYIQALETRELQKIVGESMVVAQVEDVLGTSQIMLPQNPLKKVPNTPENIPSDFTIDDSSTVVFVANYKF